MIARRIADVALNMIYVNLAFPAICGPKDCNIACNEGKVTARVIKTLCQIRSANSFMEKTHKGITESVIMFPSSCNL